MAVKKIPYRATSGVAKDDLTNVTASAGRASLGVPLPTASAGVVGEWKYFNNSAGLSLSLPAGGTWAYFCFYKDSVTNLTGSYGAGVAAGGTQVLAALGGNSAPMGFCWRIS